MNSQPELSRANLPAVFTGDQQRYIARDRLISLVDPEISSFQCGLLLGPAGSGKSVFLAQHFHSMQERGYQVAWLSVSARMADPYLFFIALAQAITKSRDKTVQGNFFTVHRTSASPDSLARHLNELLGEIEGRFILYIDDFHLAENKQTTDFVNFLIAGLRVGVVLMIASRVRPQIRVASRKMVGNLIEISGQQLSFSEVETSKYLGSAFSKTASHQWYQLTEGWPAGLQLTLALSELITDEQLRKITHAPKTPGELLEKHGLLVDFLSEEVFGNVPDEIQKFLLYTSILNKFSVEIANHLLDINCSGKHITWLQEHNIFISPSEEGKTWYRYHLLFREFLFEKLKTNYPDVVTALQIKAANWFVSHGDFAAAIEFALESRDVDCINHVARAVGGLHLSWTVSVEIWSPLKKLPQELIECSPELLLAWILFLLNHNEIEHAREQYDRLIALFPPEERNSGKERAHFWTVDVPIIELSMSIYEDNIWPTERLESLEKRLQGYPGMDPIIRSACLVLMAFMYHQAGDFEKSIVSANAAKQLSDNAQGIIVSDYACLARGISLFADGRIAEAENAYKEGLRYLAKVKPPARAQEVPLQILLAEIELERGNIQAAGQVVSDPFTTLAGMDLWPEGAYSAYRVASWAKFTENFDPLPSIELLDQGLLLFSQPHFRRLRDLLTIQKAKLLLACEDLINSRSLLEKLIIDYDLSERSDGKAPNWLATMSLLSVSTLLEIISGNVKAAETLLKEYSQWQQRLGARYFSLDIMLCRAAQQWQFGSRAVALRYLSSALDISQETSQQLPFHAHRCWLESFIRTASDNSSRGKEQNVWIVDSIRALIGNPGQSSLSPRSSLNHSVPQGLSPRETQVFHFLCDGLTSKEIAKELDLSINTVLGYRREIYKKLGVSTRSEVVLLGKAAKYGKHQNLVISRQ